MSKPTNITVGPLLYTSPRMCQVANRLRLQNRKARSLARGPPQKLKPIPLIIVQQ
jgi:hypothetical protein